MRRRSALSFGPGLGGFSSCIVNARKCCGSSDNLCSCTSTSTACSLLRFIEDFRHFICWSLVLFIGSSNIAPPATIPDCVSIAFHKTKIRSICLTSGALLRPFERKNPTRREFRNAEYSTRLRVMRLSPEITTQRPSALSCSIQSRSFTPGPNLALRWTTSWSSSKSALSAFASAGGRFSSTRTFKQDEVRFQSARRL